MRRSFLIFFSLFFTGWALVHLMIGFRLADAGLPAPALVPILVFLCLSFPAARALLALQGRRPALRPLARGLDRIGNLWMGLAFMFLICFPASSLLRAAARAGHWPAADRSAPWSAGAAGAAMALFALGVARGRRGPVAKRFQVDRRGRYGQGRECRLVQISDVHLGLTLGVEYLRRVVDLINRENPDLVLLTGDLMDPEVGELDAVAATFRGLRARQGAYAVSGNHEFYSGVGRFLALMGESGIQVLDNEMRITAGGIQVAGIHDPTANAFRQAGLRSDLAAALREVRGDAPSVLLAHQPRDLDAAVARGVDLVLSGHTHNGQVFPFTLLVRLSFKYLKGIYRLGPHTDLVVCQGTGFWGPPMRLGSESQIVVVDLKY